MRRGKKSKRPYITRQNHHKGDSPEHSNVNLNVAVHKPVAPAFNFV